MLSLWPKLEKMFPFHTTFSSVNNHEFYPQENNVASQTKSDRIVTIFWGRIIWSLWCSVEETSRFQWPSSSSLVTSQTGWGSKISKFLTVSSRHGLKPQNGSVKGSIPYAQRKWKIKLCESSFDNTVLTISFGMTMNYFSRIRIRFLADRSHIHRNKIFDHISRFNFCDPYFIQQSSEFSSATFYEYKK